jgi:hypothetical protein
MTEQSNTISKLLKQIAKQSENWFEQNIPKYIPQQVDFTELPPNKLIQIGQSPKWRKKLRDD